MEISILTLFPQMFQGPFDHSIVKRAKDKGLIKINLVNLRDYGLGPHKSVDDAAYGGGVGMVIRVDVIENAIVKIKKNGKREKVVLLSARGTPFNQAKAHEYAADLESLILVCGHYEGIDDRVSSFISEEISIGDFITTGGEIPAMLVTDAVVRLIPGVLKPDATQNESFSLSTDNHNLLEYPQYTRPKDYKGKKVPEVLLSGNHAKIAEWRSVQAKEITKKIRPELLKD